MSICDTYILLKNVICDAIELHDYENVFLFFVLFCFVLFLLGDKSLKGVLGGVLPLEHRAKYEQV